MDRRNHHSPCAASLPCGPDLAGMVLYFFRTVGITAPSFEHKNYTDVITKTKQQHIFSNLITNLRNEIPHSPPPGSELSGCPLFDFGPNPLSPRFGQPSATATPVTRGSTIGASIFLTRSPWLPPTGCGLNPLSLCFGQPPATATPVMRVFTSGASIFLTGSPPTGFLPRHTSLL